MNRIAMIVLLASFCLVVPAHAKPCRALCAEQIGTCRTQCSEGTRRDRRRCRASCIKSVMAACRQIAEPVCVAPPSNQPNGDPPPTSDGEDPPATGDGGDDGGACGPASTCESLAEWTIGWQPGVSATPPGFPPPPPGAVLCGADSANITFYLYSGPMSEVVEYYRQQLQAQGMSFSGPHTEYVTRTECDELYLYERPGQVVPDQLYAFVHNGHFTITGYTAQ
jgi:hypothetical protein